MVKLYLEHLGPEMRNQVYYSPSSTKIVFGNGEGQVALYKATVPAKIGCIPCMIECDIRQGKSTYVAEYQDAEVSESDS